MVDFKTKKKKLDRLVKTKSAPNVVVRALAGSGKTFTQIVGIAWAFGRDWKEIQKQIAIKKGLDPKGFVITPTDEQRTVWESMAESENPKTILYSAFNKSIVQEFTTEWGWLNDGYLNTDLQFATVNSLGSKALYAAYGRLGLQANRVDSLIAERFLGQSLYQARMNNSDFIKGVRRLVSLSKLTLLGWYKGERFDADDITNNSLSKLATTYDIDLDQQMRAFDAARMVLKICSEEVDENREIDFDDQNWLPVIHNMITAKRDIVLIDESQDLSRVRQEFLLRMAKRVIAVGDVHQSIYAFAGADPQSIPRLEKMLKVSTPLKLSTTRRCSKAVVRECNRIVPEFKASPENPEGEVLHRGLDDYAKLVNDKDLCLCRCNGPLVSQALKFLASGRKVTVRGRQFGQSLINFIKGLDAETVEELRPAVDNWADKENEKESRKKYPSDSKRISISDRVDCIYAFCEKLEPEDPVERVTDLIYQVFNGKECPECHKKYDEETARCPICKTEPDPINGKYLVGPRLEVPEGVVFSSIHKAKGLEADSVFLLQLNGASVPHPMAKSDWQRKQESNLKYVALSRAKNRLVYVTEPKEKDE